VLCILWKTLTIALQGHHDRFLVLEDVAVSCLSLIFWQNAMVISRVTFNMERRILSLYISKTIQNQIIAVILMILSMKRCLLL